MKKSFFMLCFCVLAGAQIRAQLFTVEDLKVQLLKDWDRARTFTNAYLNTMPADKYTSGPVDSIRNFAQQMLHLAQANLFLMSNATDFQPPAFIQADLEHSATAQTKDSVVYYVNASYDYCMEAVKNTDVTKWGEKKKIFRFEEPRIVLMMKAFEHQTHHRGQATIYIRTQGIKPPNEQLF